MAYSGLQSYRGPYTTISGQHVPASGAGTSVPVHYAGVPMHQPFPTASFGTTMTAGGGGYPVQEHPGFVSISQPPLVARKLNSVPSFTSLTTNAPTPVVLEYSARPQPTHGMVQVPSLAALLPGVQKAPLAAAPVAVAVANAPAGSYPGGLVSQRSEAYGVTKQRADDSAAAASATAAAAAVAAATADVKALQAQMEALRRSVVAQEDRIAHLTQDLQASRDSEGRAVADAEAAHDEAMRLREELRQEREWREQAEAADLLTPPASATKRAQVAAGKAQAKGKARPTSTGAMRRNLSASDVKAGAPNEPPSARFALPEPPPLASGRSSRGSSFGAASLGALGATGAAAAALRVSARGRSSAAALKEPQQDDIDIALRTFLERGNCGLTFRRMNRGWYAFSRPGERNPGGDRMVELSMVGGKLKARMEPSSHEKGWNNSKAGDIDRFCAYIVQVDDE